jgi:hypothetical protein
MSGTFGVSAHTGPRRFVHPHMWTPQMAVVGVGIGEHTVDGTRNEAEASWTSATPLPRMNNDAQRQREGSWTESLLGLQSHVGSRNQY